MDSDDTELTAIANVSDETTTAARDATSDDTALAPSRPADETIILADETDTELAKALAWSETGVGPTEPAPYVEGRSAWRWAVVTLAVMLPLIGVVALGMVFFQTRHGANTRASGTASPPGAVLDGTYRLDLDLKKQTINGAPHPQSSTMTAWWAFRSSCRPSGCVATATMLDDTNHQVPSTRIRTGVFHFVDGNWQGALVRPAPYPCAPGTNLTATETAATKAVAFSLQPQSDGTLRGLSTQTVLTDQCGNQGMVYQLPAIAKRSGDPPSGVPVADPATVPDMPTPPAAAEGPALGGVYRLDFDQEGMAINGAPNPSKADRKSDWWAIQSACTSQGCVAAGTMLDDNTHQVAELATDVLHFVDGRWRSALHRTDDNECHGAVETALASYVWEPQPDGTLRGSQDATVENGVCGLPQGSTIRTPFVATVVDSNVPPGVILADPALFATPPA